MVLANTERVLACVALVGCAGLQNEIAQTPHLPAVARYDFWLDPSLSPLSVAAVQLAAGQWGTSTGAAITLHSGAHVCLVDCFSIHEVGQEALDEVTDGNYVGYTIPGFLFLAAGKAEAEANETAIHEMGHALGLIHHPAPAFAVMGPTYGAGSLHVACDDVAQYFAVRGTTPPSTLPRCSDAPGP